MNRTWINLLVILSLLLSSAGINQPALAYTPSSSGQEATPGATPEATLTPTPATAPENGAYPPPEATPPLPTEPSPSPTPLPPTEPSPTPTPEESPPHAAWSISASANPAIYVPGKPLNIYWTIAGDQPLPASAGAQIRIIGVAVPEPGGDPLPERELILPVTGMQGELTWEIEPGAEFPMYLTLDLLLENSVLDSEVIEIGLADQEISSLEGGVIEGLGGKVRLEVPSAALEENAYFSVRYPSPNKTPAVSLTGMPIEIIAVGKDSGQNLTQFEHPIQIQIRYDLPELINWSEDDLRVFYYNENDRDWYALPTQVDTENRLLTTHSDHLTVFDFKAATWQANTLPTVDSFKVSDFTGAAAYSYTFQTPPGVAGLSPELSLEYNSQVMDEGSAYSQASWVGMGWSLDTGAITRNMRGTNDKKDDTFLISANGISGLLLPVSVNGALLTYNTADQSFLKVQFDSANNQWTAWSKDGRVYQYDKTAKTDTSNGCVPDGGTLDLTWRWALGSVTDKNGNTITYSYDRDKKRAGCLNEIAIYPATITYSHGLYRVSFNWEARSDYQNSWNEDAAMTLFSKRRLKEIRFEHAPSGIWTTPANITLVRKYVFGYAADTATTNVIYPNFEWKAGGRTLTLTSVQEISGDGSLSLPATTFYYGDEDGDGVDESMHLTRVDNGLGGQVEMQYTRWSYFDDFNDDLRSLLTIFGDASHECSLAWNYGTSWDAVTGSLACDPTADYDLNIWKTGIDAAVAQRSIPEHVIKPGSLYRFHITARAKTGTADINWGFFDETTENARMLFSDDYIPYVEGVSTDLEGTLDMPASFDPSKTQLRLEVDGNILISKLQFMLFPLYYRVTSRTVTDAATGQQHTYTYRYDNPSANTAYTSAAVEAAGSDCSNLNTCALREFRGHAVTQVTDPSGLTNVTWYYQSDALKGQPYHTMTVKQSFADDFEQKLSESTHWAISSGVSDREVIENQDFDYALKAENTQSNWDVSIERS